jgi:ribosomal protein S25
LGIWGVISEKLISKKNKKQPKGENTQAKKLGTDDPSRIVREKNVFTQAILPQIRTDIRAESIFLSVSF